MRIDTDEQRNEALNFIREDIKARCEELIVFVKKAKAGQTKVYVGTNSGTGLIVTADEVRIDSVYDSQPPKMLYNARTKTITIDEDNRQKVQELLIQGRKKVRRECRCESFSNRQLRKSLKNSLASRKVRRTKRRAIAAVFVLSSIVPIASYFGVKVAYNDNQISITREPTTTQSEKNGEDELLFSIGDETPQFCEAVIQ